MARPKTSSRTTIRTVHTIQLLETKASATATATAPKVT